MKNRYCQFCGTLLPEDGICLRCGSKYTLDENGQLKVVPRKVKKVSAKVASKKKINVKKATDPSEAETQTIHIPVDSYSFTNDSNHNDKHADWTGDSKPREKKAEPYYVPNFKMHDERTYENGSSFNNSGHYQYDDLTTLNDKRKKNENSKSATGSSIILFIVVMVLTALLVYFLLMRGYQNGVTEPAQTTTLTTSTIVSTTVSTTNVSSVYSPTNEKVVMPYVVNLQVENARKMLEEKGFVIDEYAFHYSYKSEYIGLVRFATLRAGQEYPKGTHVTLQVWTGESVNSKTTLLYADERPVTVPQYKGVYYPDIKQDLAESSDFVFEIEEGDYIYSGSTGTIVDQYPYAGTVVPAGTKVKLYVAKRPLRTTTWVES